MQLLDTNPERAAKSLVPKDILKCYKQLHKHFSTILANLDSTVDKDFMTKFTFCLIMPTATLANKVSFKFYWDYFIELEKCVNEIYGIKEYIQRDFTINSFKKFVKQLPNINQVVYLRIRKNKSSGVIPRGIPVDYYVYDYAIKSNRIEYICNEYTEKDFYYGVPTWYIFTNPVIIEKFSLKERKFLRIVSEKGRYRYYISNYRYDWEEIKNIPDIVQSIIETLIFT